MVVLLRFGLIIACLFTVAACSEARFLIAGAKKISNAQEGGYYKVGNPYQIKGIWYYPEVNYDYDETGIASWYGPNFHGKKTANGEIFDMNAVSAAHKTLPMPSVVRVTNLENGRSITARLNDRGPFSGERIIDMSRRAAQLLGFEQQGIAKVRVQVLADESRQLAALAQRGQALSASKAPIKAEAMPKEAVASAGLAPPPGGKASVGGSAVPSPPPARAPQSSLNTGAGSVQVNQGWQPTEQVEFRAVPAQANLWVQAGSFTQFDNANRARARLSGIGRVDIAQVLVDGRDYFRVRIGPVPTVEQADALLARVIGAGYPGSKITVD
ncbi:MAG: septal ring lytic transglycosylase RlpA family protein [Magnetovibrionaceae bacterium]